MDEIVQAIVGGDATQLGALSAYSDEEYAEAVAGREFVLTPETVAEVLTRYSEGGLSQADTQRWASFVKRGQVWLDQPVTEIAYEQQHETAIVEAIARMDELGDVIDGRIDPPEARNWSRTSAGRYEPRHDQPPIPEMIMQRWSPWRPSLHDHRTEGVRPPATRTRWRSSACSEPQERTGRRERLDLDADTTASRSRRNMIAQPVDDRATR